MGAWVTPHGRPVELFLIKNKLLKSFLNTETRLKKPAI